MNGIKTAAILVGLWFVLIIPVTLTAVEFMGEAGKPIAAWFTLAIVGAVWFLKFRRPGERTPDSTS